MTRRYAVLVAALAVCLMVAPGEAQVTTGTIQGTVKDNTGAVVPGATVTVTESGKQTSSTYTTDSEGGYTAPFLIPGTYEISVEMQGFRKHLRRGVVLQVNQRFPNASIGSPTAGRITTTVGDNRQMQFAAKLDW